MEDLQILEEILVSPLIANLKSIILLIEFDVNEDFISELCN